MRWDTAERSGVTLRPTMEITPLRSHVVYMIPRTSSTATRVGLLHCAAVAMVVSRRSPASAVTNRIHYTRGLDDVEVVCAGTQRVTHQSRDVIAVDREDSSIITRRVDYSRLLVLHDCGGSDAHTVRRDDAHVTAAADGQHRAE